MVAELLSLDCRAHVGKETGKFSLRPVSEAWSSLRGMQNWGNVKGKQWKFLLGPENHSTEDMTSSAFSQNWPRGQRHRIQACNMAPIFLFQFGPQGRWNTQDLLLPGVAFAWHGTWGSSGSLSSHSVQGTLQTLYCDCVSPWETELITPILSMKKAVVKCFTQGQHLNSGLSDPRPALFLWHIETPNESQALGEGASQCRRTQDLAPGSNP